MCREFSFIHDYFAPLAAPEGLGLLDDAALINMSGTHVITTDTLVETVHFIGDEPPSLLAKKCLRVSLSDLAAMGATPAFYTLNLSLPKYITEDWFADFASGLSADQERYGIRLIGGDLTATPGPIILTATLFGVTPLARALQRKGARVGDDIYIAGTIGEAALGLDYLQGRLALGDINYMPFVSRYRLPDPPSALGPKLLGVASAAIDISDGLLQDLGHICKASGVGAEVYVADLPLSAEASECLVRDVSVLTRIVSGGDDYTLCFTVPPESEDILTASAAELKINVTKVGRITQGNAVQLLDFEGAIVPISKHGYSHFLSANTENKQQEF